MNINVKQLQNGWLVSCEWQGPYLQQSNYLSGIYIAESNDLGPAIQKIADEQKALFKREVETRENERNQYAAKLSIAQTAGSSIGV